MKKRRVLAAIMTATLALSLAGCGGSSGDSKSSGSSDGSVANADKPLCWFNRQPSNSSTGELDKEALNFNDDTYYVGFDANQGAELQGQMVVDYIKANADKIDRNGDTHFPLFFFSSTNVSSPNYLLPQKVLPLFLHRIPAPAAFV